MGPGIIIPLVIVAIAIPLAFTWAKKTFKETAADAGESADAPAARLTSNALRDLPTPEWRVVYEIATERLGGIEHVLVGPPGVFAIQTSMDTLPSRSGADAQAVAKVAILRGDLDDALTRCAMTSDRLVRVHWGPPPEGRPAAVDVFPGLTAVDGRRLPEWAATMSGPLSSAQVDLAWQTVTTAIGRPDPLA